MNKGNALGVVELSGISRGYHVQDAMLKAANVEKIVARTICSGKYMIIIRGDVSSVEAAIAAGKEKASFALVNTTTIPNLDPQVFPAIAGATTLQPEGEINVGALLIIETFSVVSAIMAADYAAKEAQLTLLRIHAAMAIGGKGLVIISGDISSLEAAVVPAVDHCKGDGMLADFIVIKNPHEDVLKDLL